MQTLAEQVFEAKQAAESIPELLSQLRLNREELDAVSGQVVELADKVAGALAKPDEIAALQV